ncbi:hypothetical protein HPB51_014698 [Rhipicephalus microplus]|uniref:PNT domain-containing protein n=1 Tax=Rhipicephalus microplus TaxID=6941 RepID=A0A9J6DN50_RHIMP|nr:hypothetical protein HPB51_014698 [Rhipicephalus microplus]
MPSSASAMSSATSREDCCTPPRSGGPSGRCAAYEAKPNAALAATSWSARKHRMVLEPSRRPVPPPPSSAVREPSRHSRGAKEGFSSEAVRACQVAPAKHVWCGDAPAALPSHRARWLCLERVFGDETELAQCVASQGHQVSTADCALDVNTVWLFFLNVPEQTVAPRPGGFVSESFFSAPPTAGQRNLGGVGGGGYGEDARIANQSTRRYRGPRRQADSTHAGSEGQPPTDGLRRHLAAVAEPFCEDEMRFYTQRDSQFWGKRAKMRSGRNVVWGPVTRLLPAFGKSNASSRSQISANSRIEMFTLFLLAELPTQVPPLTPGTNQKMTQALTASFSSWEKERESLNIVKDPRQWSEMDVANWLSWAIREFSLEGVNMPTFAMKGKDMCALGKDAFLARFPPFMGDILWEHLDILEKAREEDGTAANVVVSFSRHFIPRLKRSRGGCPRPTHQVR